MSHATRRDRPLFYSDFRLAVSQDLADPDGLKFDFNAIVSFVKQGLAAVGRVAPDQFQEDLDPVAGQLVYPLRTAYFDKPVPEVRLVRVEVWTGTPLRFKFKIKAKAGQPARDSVAGWEVWNGSLEIPDWIFDTSVNADTDTIRVWGYSPYPFPGSDDVMPVSDELELAIRAFCRVEAMRMLVGSRTLFKQWQAKSNNTDVTLGQLNSDLAAAEDTWRRLARSLKVPEQSPD